MIGPSRQRFRPRNPASNQAPHSDHCCGLFQVAILGSPVYEVVVHTNIVPEEPFLLNTNPHR
jgi:hypothetical protein